jgi:hypothetical protein
MSYALTRTSMALDHGTLQALDYLAKLWDVSKAEVMRRSIKLAKDEALTKAKSPKPLEALDWLQNGGGLTLEESHEFRQAVEAERQAKRYWWEE